MKGPIDISSEQERVYVYPDYTITIEDPVSLYISDTGSHRVSDCSGWVTYIKNGWVLISWFPISGEPEVVL